MSNNISKVYDVFFKTEELGSTDTKKLNQIIQNLDLKNEITKDEVIEVVAKRSKDKDGAFRNFISRVKQAINMAYENSEDSFIKEVLVTMKINIIKDTTLPKVRFEGEIKEGVDTMIYNKNYDEKYYIDSIGENKKINIFVSYAKKDEREVKEFLEFVKERQQGNLITWTMKEIPVGIDFDKVIKEELKKCHYGFALISKSFLESTYIKSVELKKLIEEDKLFPILLKDELKELIQEYKEEEVIKELFKRHIFYLRDRGREDSFYNMQDDNAKELFVDEMIKDLNKREEYEKLYLENNKKNFLEAHSKYVDSRDAYNSQMYIDSSCCNIHINTSIQNEIEQKEEISEKIHLLDDMTTWINDTNTPTPIYALLGEYGVGKTFNTRMFAKRLKELHEKDKNLPYPIYMDLRDIDTFIEEDSIKRQPKIDEMIKEILRLSDNSDYSISKIIEDSKSGKNIIIFDGLDEKLVHYSKDMKNKFLRELINILDIKNIEKTKQKIVISCRNHYFNTIREQNSFLRDNERFDIGKDGFRAIELLAFDMEQIVKYISKSFDENEVTKIVEFISSDDYLKSIMSKPLMLNKITQTLPNLIKLKEQNKEINSKSFYKSLIDDSLSRDNEKHTINIRDKKRLLKEVAKLLYKKNNQNIKIDDLNDWFNEYLYENPIFKKYIEQDIDTLEQDLRNSSLLVRYGEENFGFSHSSFYEYFLSESILEDWSSFEYATTISELTQKFLVEDILSFDSLKKEQFFKALKNTLSKKEQGNKKFALDLAKELNIQNIDSIYLKNQDLQRYELKNLKIKKLTIKNSNLYGSSFKSLNIKNLNIKESNLNDSYFEKTKIAEVKKDKKTKMDFITDVSGTFKEDLGLGYLHNFKKDKNIDIEKLNLHSDFNDIKIYGDLIYAGTDSGLKIYDKEDYELKKELEIWGLNTVAIEGDLLYIGTRNGLKIYDKEDYELKKELEIGGVNTVVIEGDLLYIGTRNGLKIYDKEDYELKKELEIGLIRAVAIEGDLLYIGIGNSLKIYDKEDYELKKELEIEWINTVAIDGDLLYIGTDSGLKIYDKEDYELKKELEIWGLNTVAEGDLLYIRTRNGLKIYDKEDYELKKELEIGLIRAVAIEGDLLYIGTGSSLKIYDKEDYELKKELEIWSLNTVAIEEDLLYIGTRNSLEVYDKEDYELKKELEIWGLNTVAIEGDLFYIGTRNGLKIYDKKDYELKKELEIGWINTVDIEEDLLYIGTDSGLKIYDKEDYELKKELEIWGLNTVAIEGDLLYIGTNSGLEVYDKEDYELKKELEIEWINTVAIEGDLFYIGTDSGLKIYDKEDYKLKKELEVRGLRTVAIEGDLLYIGTNSGLKIYDKNSFTIKSYIIIQNNDWLTLDLKTNILKGTAKSWNLATVVGKDGNTYNVDEIKNFKLFKY